MANKEPGVSVFSLLTRVKLMTVTFVPSALSSLAAASRCLHASP